MIFTVYLYLSHIITKQTYGGYTKEMSETYSRGTPCNVKCNIKIWMKVNLLSEC